MDDGIKGTASASYSESFENAFPYYLSIGMTAVQYWEGDSTLVRAYRRADELRQERQNYEAWLQGAYFYDALCMVSPVLHAFARKGTKPAEYHKSPYSMTKAEEEKKELTPAEINDKVDESRKFFEALVMTRVNKKFKEKGGNHNARD